ncbi:TetR/AcrR family transcriptional regulator [Metabacillus sediminilitoris]|uniref:TetR/AcrR family transcriptional regulator n=1 Tax=Metabacillus sediminilitoris TaxID=2567941 RepID=A0A4S4BUS4_9BACI|nr:TetR/AcrR family transcriptional regulator [Metabacillus sediminilitoris]QGQ44173.1 TetR family transcriptional regulator [Metabacillus sediminilitoris]THF78137.1 TetR/AcrR family transcriptional regulator [Metabacillus sediminilitoris]
MDTKALLIEIATTLFQQKGYKGVGLNEILKECKITKGSLYHHFPNGKEELLIACLQSMEKAITTDIEDIFKRHQTTQEALHVMIEKLVADFEREGTIIGYTFSSMVSEMASLSEPVRYACSSLYTKIQGIYSNKLVEDGFSKEAAQSIALMMTASIEGAMMLCLTQKASDPLKTISHLLPKIIADENHTKRIVTAD